MSITYDLCGNQKNYDDLYNALKKYPQYARVTNTWIINALYSTPKQVRNSLSKLIDSDDRLFVAPLKKGAAWQRPIDSHSDIHDVLDS